MIKKAFFLPGQGSQYKGMGKKLCENFKTASDVFEEASEALNEDIKKLCFEGDNETLTLTKNAQPALVTMAMAMYKVCVEEVGITPNIFAGHSIGEISALTCAGAIDFADAVKIARVRGELMQRDVAAGQGKMAAVRSRDINRILEILSEVSNQNEFVGVSNYNSNVQTVISGHTKAVDLASERLEKEGCKVTPLNVSAPFHCPLMQNAADSFEEELKKYTFHDFTTPVLSNVDALPYTGKEQIIEHLTKQLVLPVRWVESMVYLKKFMVSYGVELGPGNVLRNMMKTNISDIRIYAFDDDKEIEKLKTYVENSYVPFLSRCLGIAVATQNHNFDNKEYEAGVITPYNQIEALSKKVESQGRKANQEEMEQGLNWLVKIMQTKGVTQEEQKERLYHLFYDTNSLDVFANN